MSTSEREHSSLRQERTLSCKIKTIKNYSPVKGETPLFAKAAPTAARALESIEIEHIWKYKSNVSFKFVFSGNTPFSF
jgi:hypothetical protein